MRAIFKKYYVIPTAIVAILANNAIAQLPESNKSMSDSVTNIEILSALFSKRANISQEKAKNEISLIFQTIIEEMSNGKKVDIENFGTFHKQKRNSKEKIDPDSGVKVQIPAKVLPKFTASDYLKKSLHAK